MQHPLGSLTFNDVVFPQVNKSEIVILCIHIHTIYFPH